MDLPIEWYTERGREIPGPAWTSEDMDEWDEDDVAAVRAAMEISAHERIAQLEDENQRLRDRLAGWRADYTEEN